VIRSGAKGVIRAGARTRRRPDGRRAAYRALAPNDHKWPWAGARCGARDGSRTRAPNCGRTWRCCSECVVTDCLSDAALHFMQATVAPPANLTGYLIATFRHRLANDRRATDRRSATGTAAAWGEGGERVVREVCSEASIRASAGPAADTPPLSPVLERLSRVIDSGITDDERQMLRWVSAAIPQRLIADWLGITHNAARVRVLRLRERLIEIALRSDVARSPDERDELYEFFRRSGLSERARRALAERDGGVPPRPRLRRGREIPEEDQ